MTKSRTRCFEKLGSAKKREWSPFRLFFEEYQRYTDQCQPECDGNDEFSNQQQQADEQ